MLCWRYYEVIRKKGRAIFDRNKGKPTLFSELSSKVYQLLADINTSIYGTCRKIGGSKPQLKHKQVGRTTVILDVRELKQKS